MAVSAVVIALAGLLGCGVLVVGLIAVAWAVSSNRRSGSS